MGGFVTSLGGPNEPPFRYSLWVINLPGDDRAHLVPEIYRLADEGRIAEIDGQKVLIPPAPIWRASSTACGRRGEAVDPGRHTLPVCDNCVEQVHATYRLAPRQLRPSYAWPADDLRSAYQGVGLINEIGLQWGPDDEEGA